MSNRCHCASAMVTWGVWKALTLVSFLTWSGQTLSQDISINCGGDAAEGNWLADSHSIGGYAISANASLPVVSKWTNISSKVLLSARAWGGQETESVNGYVIPLSATGDYFVRLYFVELVHNVPGLRIFGVKVGGALVLADFRLPPLYEGVVKEFFVPVEEKSLTISFIRGAAGDPIVSAIAVVHVPSEIYSFLRPPNSILSTQHRISGGNIDNYRDNFGRFWVADEFQNNLTFSPPDKDSTAQCQAFKDAHGIPKNTCSEGNNITYAPEGYLLTGSSIFFPFGVYNARRERDVNFPSEDPYVKRLNFTFGLAPSTPHVVRLAWMRGIIDNDPVYNITTIGSATLEETVLLNAIQSKSNGSVSIHASNVTSNSSGYVIVSISTNTSDFGSKVFVSTIEVFQIVDAPDSPPPPIPSPQPPAEQHSSKGAAQWGIITGCILGIAGAVLAACLLCVYAHHSHGRQHAADKAAKLEDETSADFSKMDGPRPFMARGVPTDLGGVRRFELEELREGCDDFAEACVIGRGGFGVVYKARLRNGTSVALKRLSDNSEHGRHEFFAELEILSRLHHRHLVNLVGYCDEGGSLILVYEHLSNGTLRSFLRDDAKAEAFSWPVRLRTALGAARGLHYLHSGANPPVIHRDVKTSNILLGHNFEAKIADFGLARNTDFVENLPAPSHISTNVKGTVGYLDPEYYAHQRLTEKSDVYSFGVVLLELLTSQLPVWCEEVEGHDDDEVVWLAKWACSFIRSGRTISMIDKRLELGMYTSTIELAAALAEQCVEDEGRARPAMSEVVRRLEDAIALLESMPAS